ncbi:MAG TPA: hypothetical protein VFA04_15950 [Bryobacteraceae bacterium]|nr:hypothetical protein [Bryobacteraceae bacterium]
MFYAGLDLGKRLDFSALAVVEREEFGAGDPLRPWMDTRERRGLVVRYLERMALGTPYTEVVRRVTELMERLRQKGPCRLVVDATGVGMPVVDMLRRAKPGFAMTPVLITGGAEQHNKDGVWHVPKVDLLAGLQAALEGGELRISRRLKETATLVRELGDVRVRARGTGAMRIGADGHGEHDDLVIAVALGCWAGRKGGAGNGGEGRLV